MLSVACLGCLFYPAAAEEAAEEVAEEAAEEAAKSEARTVFSPEVEAILNEASDGEGYGGLEKCIQARSIRGTEVLDDRHVVFELPSSRYYLVQFEQSCHLLRAGVTIAYEPRGSQLCRLDHVRAIESFRPGSVGPPCSIPGFYEVTKEQIVLLKETLKADRKAEMDAYKAEKAQRKAEKKAEKEARRQAEADKADS
jgi:hypothetical protein